MTTLATVVTPGYTGNDLILWLLRQDGLRFSLIERKPRESAKMEAMRAFLASGADRWLLMNHYASPQFALKDVPDIDVVSASMMRPLGREIQPIIGDRLGRKGDMARTDFIPNGCLFLKRSAVEAISEKRPFEFQHDQMGACVKADDATMSEALTEAGYDLWIWEARCLNRQECFV